jgi:adenylate kinase family enzyme
VDRIRVVGTSGAGKSTTAVAIARRLGVPCLELDAVHWLPDWQERDGGDFRTIVLDFATAQPRWVIDGNYSSRLGDSLDALTDVYVWLDLPRWQVTLAVLGRTIRRSVSHEELWGTNHERLGSLLERDPVDNIVLWSWTQHRPQRERYEQQSRASSRQWIRLRSRRAVRRFLDQVEARREISVQTASTSTGSDVSTVTTGQPPATGCEASPSHNESSVRRAPSK